MKTGANCGEEVNLTDRPYRGIPRRDVLIRRLSARPSAAHAAAFGADFQPGPLAFDALGFLSPHAGGVVTKD